MGNHHAGFGGRQSDVLASEASPADPTAGPTPARGWNGSGGSPSTASRRSTSRSGSHRCRSSASASPSSPTRRRRSTTSPPTRSPRSAPARADARPQNKPFSHERTTYVPINVHPRPRAGAVRRQLDDGGELPARIERVALQHIELAENPRREITAESIDRLAKMLCASGQLVPCIGRCPDPDQPKVILYDGQRRYLAAKASQGLAGSEYMQGLAEPVRSLIVLLLDHSPTPEEIRRLQAHCQQREELSLTDQQHQFADCWEARAGLLDADRIAAICADLGISPKRAHNLRRQLTLPETIRTRVAERPSGEQISATMANKLADMHEIAPQLTEAVVKRITSGELHDKAIRDLGAFVHRTVVEDEHTYPVRIDDGAMLDAAEQVDHARPHLTDGDGQIAAILGCEVQRLARELDALAAHARARALKVRITPEIRDRARNGRYAFVHDRGQDFAAGIWVIDPAFMLDLVHEQLNDGDTDPAREEAYFAGARLDDDELRDAAATTNRAAHEPAPGTPRWCAAIWASDTTSAPDSFNPPKPSCKRFEQIVCHLLVRNYRGVIAYGAGWTDPERQQPP